MGTRRSGIRGYASIEGVSNASYGNVITTEIEDTGLNCEFEITSVNVIPDETFTVQQAINCLGFGWFQVKLSLCIGLCWMADSMEMTILSILGPAVRCDWQITTYQQALTTTTVFLGMMLSSTFWKYFSKRYGRKPALRLCGALLCLYGLLSAVAPSFSWLLLLRGLVGFSIGCVPQSVTLYAEYLPIKQRAKCVVLLDCFWALGACFEVALALVIVPNFGWRWLLALSTAPLFLFIAITPWLPESAKFYIDNGQNEKVLSILEEVAKDNKRSMLVGRLVIDGPTNARASVRALLSANLRRTTLLLWFIWMSCAFCYYGLVLMSTEIFLNISSEGKQGINPECHSLITTNYMDLLWTTLAEFPGIFATIAIMDRCGRKQTMAFQFIIFAGCIYLINLTNNRTLLTLIIFCARGVIAGLFQAAYVYTPDVYPTPLRCVGVGGCSALARLGAMFTPYVAQVLFQISVWGAVTVYSFFGIFAAIACFLLPYESQNIDLVI